MSNHPWLAAACIILALSTITFAVFRQIKPDQHQVVVKKKLIPKTAIAFDTYHFHKDSSVEIQTHEIVSLQIKKGIILPANNSDSSEVKITDLFPFKLDSGIQGMSFFIQFNKANNKEKAFPIKVSIDIFEEENGVFYGGENYNVKSWIPLAKPTMRFIEKPTKVMQDYNNYQEAKVLLDSIKHYYALKNNHYIPVNGKGFQFNKGFILKMKRKVSKYEQQSNYDSVLHVAKADWKLYKEQHQLSINNPNLIKKNANKKKICFDIEKSGWYGFQIK